MVIKLILNMQIITESEYQEAASSYAHLFEISTPPAMMVEKDLSWLVRDEVTQGGTLMLGDLLVVKHSTKVVETHPFPEWVIQLHRIGKKSGKVYAIIPKLTPKQIKRFNRKDPFRRNEKTIESLTALSHEDFLAIEYQEGICIKIPANVPHEFISVVGEGEDNPYCQVFEPNFAPMADLVKFDVTKFYDLDFEVHL